MLLMVLRVLFSIVVLLASREFVDSYSPRQPNRGSKKSFIYILKLEKGKYYVGKTFSPSDRISDHDVGFGSAWTQKYPPVEVLNVYPNNDDYDEQKYTLQMMKKKGIDNVRGGPFCRTELQASEVEMIKKMLYGASDSCFVCGKTGHFANECPSRCGKCGNFSKYGRICSKCALPASSNQRMASRKPSSPTRANVCFRCGREGHFAGECYASYHVDGYPLDYF